VTVLSQDFTYFSKQVKGSKKQKKQNRATDMTVKRIPEKTKQFGLSGLWISERNVNDVPGKFTSRYSWWLPPVIWPQEEAQSGSVLKRLLKKGGKHFVINSPWQLSLFDHTSFRHDVQITAGPFCNISNSLFLSYLSDMKVSSAIVSPELSGEDFLKLPSVSPIPLGIVLFGNWPVAVSRTKLESLKMNTSFHSPKGEEFWVKKTGENFWVYPNWYLDLRKKRAELQKAGYSFFVSMIEPVPKSVSMKKRKGLWNWDLKLL